MTTIYKTLQIKLRESTIEEGQATQWPKVTGQIDNYLQNITEKTKRIHKLKKDRQHNGQK